MSEELDVEAIKARFLNEVFDERTFTLTADAIRDYALACGEVSPEYTDPGHPEFRAPPTMPSSFSSGRSSPEGFPKVAGLGMDAGKAVHPHLPIRPDVEMTGKTHLHDVYTKTGRSGRMVFFVYRMEITDPDGTLLAEADTSAVIRERPAS